ncbi:flavin reductase family protein [Shimia sp. R10_1]|uniref:flavin reductase family protein n=1 Tax=Shimia sp. R10_1 TaxID=2821095 RepID=UPI001AD9DF3A|nr:flavin reductase family protein [Shimia sp. R10_1]MBO9475434.1 flavin reductase family protein [Shimia sp. R10_1]
MLDPIEFTSAMRKAPTPVSIVTTSGEHGPHGATVSAVCSLTAAPPAVLICINKNSRILGMIEEHGVYCVNYAAQHHNNLALAFAGVPDFAEQRTFKPENWSIDPTTSLPVLIDAAATFTCLHIQTVSFGTHRILIGKVERAESNDARPLTYWDGNFKSLA